MKNGFKNNFVLICIMTVGFTLRVIHLYFYSKSPLFTPVGLDELYHHLWALRIAEGAIVPKAVFFRAPFYTYLIGLFYLIFGKSLLIARIPGILSGVVTICLAYVFGMQVGKSKRAALIAAAIVAINPILIYFESRLLLDYLLIPFGLAIIIFMLKWWDTKKAVFLFIAGIFAGLFAITRPTILIFMPVCVAWLFFVNSDGIKRFLKFAFVLFIGTILPILPVTISNISNGSNTLIASQGGINFYIGNNTNSDGISAVVPELGDAWHYNDAVAYMSQETRQENPSTKQVSSYYFRKGIDFFKNEPVKAIKLLVKKIFLSIHGVFLGNNGDISFYKSYSPILKIPDLTGILFAFGLIGLILYTRDKRLLIITLFFIVYVLTISIFFVNSRFRLPYYVILVVFSSVLIDNIIKSPKTFFKGKLKFAPILLFIPLLTIDWTGAGQLNRGDYHFTLGNSYMAQGDYDRARVSFEESLSLKPSKKSAHLNLGIIHFIKKDYKKAIDEFELEIKNNGDIAKAYSNIGLINRLEGEYKQAVQNGEKAVNSCGDRRDAFFNLAITYHEIDNPSKMLEITSAALKTYPDDIRLNYVYAQAMSSFNADSSIIVYVNLINTSEKNFIENYDFGSSLQNIWGLSRDDMHYVALSAFNVATLYAGKREYAQTETYLLKAAELDPEMKKAYHQLGNLHLTTNNPAQALIYFDKAISLGEYDGKVFYNKALALARMNRLTEARENFIMAIKRDPSIKDAEAKIALIDNLLMSKK